MLVQFDPDPRAPARIEIMELWRRQGLFERLDVCKYYPADQTVPADRKPVLRLQVFHIRTPVSALDISAAGIEHVIPARARKQQIRNFPAHAQPIELPKRQHIPTIVPQFDILAQIDL